MILKILLAAWAATLAAKWVGIPALKNVSYKKLLLIGLLIQLFRILRFPIMVFIIVPLCILMLIIGFDTIGQVFEWAGVIDNYDTIIGRIFQ